MMWIPFIQGDGWLRDLPPAQNVPQALEDAHTEARAVNVRVCVGVRRADAPRPNVAIQADFSLALAGMGTHVAVRSINSQMGSIRRKARRVKA